MPSNLFACVLIFACCLDHSTGSHLRKPRKHAPVHERQKFVHHEGKLLSALKSPDVQETMAALDADRDSFRHHNEENIGATNRLSAQDVRAHGEPVQSADELAEWGRLEHRFVGQGAGEDPAVKHMREQWEKARDATKDTLDKENPVMTGINKMRTIMCWDRDNLLDHEECLKYLGVNCIKGSTGAGICQKYFDMMEKMCKIATGNHEEEVCKYLHDLDVVAKPMADADANGHADIVDVPSQDPEKGTAENIDKKKTDEPVAKPDLDKDGIPDLQDDDIDGDGHLNKADEDPRDPKIGERDRDGDGTVDSLDVFPDDPHEWKDTDKDGVGDNADSYPQNPNCHKDPCEPPGGAKDGTEVGDEDVAHKMNKVERKLPEHGYDEISPLKVEHDDMKTMTKDWQREWPMSDDNYRATMQKICAEDPENAWCSENGFAA